ncbi:MAG: PVC-type heme-binding CxxCH protein, partial [Bythopirellula sp.]
MRTLHCTFLVVSWLISANLVCAKQLEAKLNADGDRVNVYYQGSTEPLLTQHAQADFRPYLHPIVAPDGKGVLTEYSPGHHKHQTGLYWGFTRVNGRDYFHHPEGDYWQRVSIKVLQGASQGETGPVQWQTVYHLLDEQRQVVMIETQIWTMRAERGKYVLELQWTGDAKTDVTVGKYDYGGLFLRMPWRKGMHAEVVNAARQRDLKAEGQRAPWIDLGMQVDGRDDLVHIAMFDHPKNHGFPQPWRVDGQFGVGPALARLGDWKIAAGQKAVLRYQLPIYTGPLKDVELTEAWSKFSGKAKTSTLWHLARQEGRDSKFLNPQQAVDAMTVAEGFQASVWASEPMITQPMAFCWDDRGRLWIAENRDYENRRAGFANSGDSRILILEDTDRDGVADRRQVFLEGIPFPAALAVGFEGLWLGAPPNLLFIPDRDRDDQADLDDIEIHLTGWGIDDRHETINSLHWGPDGWLYGCQGFATSSRVGKPANPKFTFPTSSDFPEDIEYDGPTQEINGGVFRYHPTQRKFEVVAHGFSNPWGIDFDAKGQIFITACVIPRLWHVIPGGIYHRQGGRHFNPYVYSDIRTIADHRHRSAHGGARVYLSDAFPERYQGQIFMANIHEHAVLADKLEPNGSGFVGRHGEDFLLANNAQWVGFSVEIGPDGALYVLDWHDADICGADVVNKETGRIFRIAPTPGHATDWPGRYTDLHLNSDAELVAMQLQKSAWHARRARLILQGRAAQRSIDAPALADLRAIYEQQSSVDFRLRAMWALHAVGNLSPQVLLESLEDREPYIRAWAIQLLCEAGQPTSDCLARFVALAASDPAPVVRLYLAAALQRIDLQQRWPIAQQLVRHSADATDHNIPKMLWFGIEPAVPTNPARALELASASQLPLVTRHIARRLADADQFESVVDALVKLPQGQRSVLLALLLGLRDALDGRFDIEPPPSWQEAYLALQANEGEIAKIATDIAGQFGDTKAAAQMFEVLGNGQSTVEARRQAIRNLSRQRHPGLRPLLADLLNDVPLRRDAIQAACSYRDDHLARQLVARYPGFTAVEKLDAVHTLAARSSSGQLLTRAIENGEVPREDIPAYVARLLRR